MVTREVFTAGARLTCICPKPARTLELEITALTDIDASYRTVGLGAAGPAACTAEAPAQPLAVAASTGDVAGGFPVTLVVGIGVTTIVAAAVALRRRRRQVPARR